MMEGEPDLIDELQDRLPSPLRWCFCGAGAATGWYYARTAATPIPFSYIIGGAALGFCLTGLAFMMLRLLKIVAVICIFLAVLNYAVLIPFGYGDHTMSWLDDGRAALRWLNPAPLVARWGKSVEIRPAGR